MVMWGRPKSSPHEPSQTSLLPTLDPVFADDWVWTVRAHISPGHDGLSLPGKPHHCFQAGTCWLETSSLCTRNTGLKAVGPTQPRR